MLSSQPASGVEEEDACKEELADELETGVEDTTADDELELKTILELDCLLDCELDTSLLDANEDDSATDEWACSELLEPGTGVPVHADNTNATAENCISFPEQSMT